MHRTRAASAAVLDTPEEWGIFDTNAHKSLNPGTPDVRIVDRMTLPHGNNPEDPGSETLPIACKPRSMGRGSAGTVTPRMPWYPRLAGTVCGRVGFRADEFIAHRSDTAYPPMPTWIFVQFLLPEGV
ncbi:MAG: hypothetical protein ACK4WH_10065 [Phycisphaerales bacterium]